jgi:NAD+ diphosphatase
METGHVQALRSAAEISVSWPHAAGFLDVMGRRGAVSHTERRPAAVPYTGVALDRAESEREDPAWVAELAVGPSARAWLLWRDHALVSGDPPVPVTARPAAAGDLAELVLLGRDSEASEFAVDLSALSRAEALARAGATDTADTRALFESLTAREAGTLAHARGLLYWHRHQRFCGRCGCATESRHAGHVRVCTGPDCGALLFPRIEPAIITLVESAAEPRRCLLARHRASKAGRFSLLAGFAELGESLEDAVRREIREEAGIPLGRVRYAGSQPWPFPAGLMVGFRALAADDAVTPDGDEICAARWFTRGQLREYVAATGWLGRADSIDRIMLTAWLSEDGDEPESA